ncbi:hypothetical protein OPU71_05565 [Niveibacterium sp. 24ML]|uniref:hypothetical protein n=1 Tax=Niveibacterium sp. 24ML TaxID=2985512 RepID=UPI00226DAEA0|nr:hypothetical protein [Niveibacterium sp. 24ML]MCX9155589.1 hypothetical protein [Niveibacterium sp. 24ML]
MRNVRLLCLLVGLSACATQPPMPRPGSDQDAHGCRGSAGYAWCAREAACVRPWELAKEKTLEPGAPAFEDYCRAP